MTAPADAAAAVVDAAADVVRPRPLLIVTLIAIAAGTTFFVVRYLGRQLDMAHGVVIAEHFANAGGDQDDDDEEGEADESAE